jgi:hypothetical protein
MTLTHAACAHAPSYRWTVDGEYDLHELALGGCGAALCGSAALLKSIWERRPRRQMQLFTTMRIPNPNLVVPSLTSVAIGSNNIVYIL